jgi:hypothetical protein
MILLLDCHLLGGWPICVATKAVGPSGGNVVLGLPPLISAGDAVVVGANWMEPMQTAVGAHVADLHHLGLPAHAIAGAASAGTALGSWFLLLVIFVAMAAMVAVSFLILPFIVISFSFVCTLTALSVTLAAPVLASCWMYSLISSPYSAS